MSKAGRPISTMRRAGRRTPRTAIPGAALRAVALGAALWALPAMTAAAADKADTLKARCLEKGPEGDWRSCEVALKALPGDLAVRRQLGFALLINGTDYDRAVLIFRRIVRDHPDSADSHYELSAVLGTLNRFVEAERPVLKALELAPDHRKALQLATIVYGHLKQPERALPYTRTLAERGDRLAMFDMAQHYEAGQIVPRDPALAVTWFERAAAKGHIAAMDRLSEIHLEGLLDQPVDRDQGVLWATRARAARKE